MGRRLVARPVRSSLQRRTPSVLTVLALAGACLVTGASPASAVQARQPRLVSSVPAGFTPAVKDGTVFAIAAVGADVVLGGSFTKVSPAGSGAVYSLPKAMEFTARSGAIHRGFAPRINGTVNTVIPGPRANQVYVGGTFSQVDGKSMRVALLDTRTGRLVPGWHPSAMNSGVNKLVLAGGRLFVGGAFTTVGGHAHHGLASLVPSTGKVTSYVGLSFTGHHNYDRLCDPKTTKCAKGDPGVRGMDIDPAGKRMVVTGDFTDASGHARDQVAMVDLGRAHAKIDLHWSTLAYSAECFANSFDSYIRDVQFSPDGSYFVIVATGGIGRNRDHTRSSCDSAARYETSRSGSDVRPTWIDYTGEDSLWSVAITGTAVYVGGHQRWLDNTLGENVAGPGAIPRPGIAALSPTSGLPYSLGPRPEPSRRGLLRVARHLERAMDRQRHRLRRQPAVPATQGRVLPAGRRQEGPGRVDAVAAGLGLPGRRDGAVRGRPQPTVVPGDHPQVRRCPSLADHWAALDLGAGRFHGRRPHRLRQTGRQPLRARLQRDNGRPRGRARSFQRPAVEQRRDRIRSDLPELAVHLLDRDPDADVDVLHEGSAVLHAGR